MNFLQIAYKNIRLINQKYEIIYILRKAIFFKSIQQYCSIVCYRLISYKRLTNYFSRLYFVI